MESPTNPGRFNYIAGALFVRPELYGDMWELRSRMGNIMAPLEAFPVERSLKTYSLRWEEHKRNTAFVLEKLSALRASGEITKLFYPGFGDNEDQDELASRHMVDRGSVVSFVPNRNREELARKISDLEFIHLAPSFGSTQSLIEICSLMSRPDASREELLAEGIEPSLVRLSVGTENSEAVISDIEKIFS